MVRRRFFLFRVILSCWAGRGKTPGKAAKAKERATQEKDSNLEEKDSSLSICAILLSFISWPEPNLLLIDAWPEPNLKCIMRPYYYPLGGGVRRDTLVIGNPIPKTGGGVWTPRLEN